jgi:hypothetical protein
MAQPDKVVRISLNSQGLPVPDQDPVQVKKSEQKLKWSASFPFTINIDGYADVKYGSGDDDGAHNCKTGYFHEERKHKYSITANGVTNDPEVDIKP